MKTVVVGSKNPVKLQVTKEAFAEVFPNETFEFVSFESVSGVPDQPFGISETRTGAYNRARACQDAHPKADYFVGHEGGIEVIDDEYWSTAWMCVIGRNGQKGFGRSAAFLLPEKMVTLIKSGKELGHATDTLFGVENSKQSGSTISFLTHGIVNRVRLYRDAVIFALIPFIRDEFYSND